MAAFMERLFFDQAWHQEGIELYHVPQMALGLAQKGEFGNSHCSRYDSLISSPGDRRKGLSEEFLGEMPENLER